MEQPKLTTSRTQLAEWLREKLPASFTVVDHPTMPDDPADNISAIVLIVRRTVDPGPVAGVFIETHELWVLDPHIDREISETQLDASLDQVLLAINDEADEWLVFVKAERDTFADEYPAYQVTVTLPSTHPTDPDPDPDPEQENP